MHTQHLTNHFDTLPIEVLIVLFSHLSPEQVALSATVNKQFKIAIADNLFWEEKFKKHFPHIYEKMSRLSISNWYAEFCKIYEDEYKKLPRRLRRLFSSIKEVRAFIASRKNARAIH